MALTLPGSPYVESSDLVANYPAVSESLAERVDLVGVLPFANSAARTTALPTPTDGQYSYLQDTNATEYYNGTAWVAAGSSPGLSLITSATVSAASSVSIDSCFSALYTVYELVWVGTQSAQSLIRCRLRSGGTDNTTTNYRYSGFYVYIASTGYSLMTRANNDPFGIVGNANVDPNLIEISVANPFQTAKTVIMSDSSSADPDINRTIVGTAFNGTTSFDGFTILPASGTITGTLWVYGRKASL